MAQAVRQTAGFNELISELGVTIDPQLFELALTHRSYAYENGGIPTNERLEFLGDSVLGVTVTTFLYTRFPQYPEGQLAKLRASVVSATSLAVVARQLNIGPMIKLGHGEQITHGDDKDSILADTMEALIGAVYLSSGRDDAEKLVHHLFDPVVLEANLLGAGLDWKTSLQEICASQGWESPRYEITETGPDHDKRFEATVVVNSTSYPSGRGKSKKQAEKQAAGFAFKQIKAQLIEQGQSVELDDKLGEAG